MFPISEQCNAGVHCAFCRQCDNREWRQSGAAHGWLPADALDGACPHGRPWGFQGVGLPIVTSEQRAAVLDGRREACADCHHYRPVADYDRLRDASPGRPARPGCLLMTAGSACAYAAALSNPLSTCPAERWPTLEVPT